jgi:uncharacterized repeat protein (TIGR01451 family)/MYXO-CTERM domain-containing protein
MKIAVARFTFSVLARISCAALAAFATAACSERVPEPAAAAHHEAVVLAQCSSSGGSGGSSSAGDTDAGALIVDLGTTPQTQGNALKPYGMAYDLVKNQKIPLLWAYNTSKALSTDVDFSVDGRSFRSSSFVIPAGFVNAAQATVSKWVAQGVQVYGPTRAAFTPPTYFKRLTGFPNIVLDPQNGAVAQGYLTAAGFPIFPVQYPNTLNTCQDMFVLPHADPTWQNHGNLKSFVTNGGFLWAGCHAVSVLESIDGNADGVPDMDFLSTSGLVNYANHTGGYPPYNYSASSLAEPVMQFLGGVDSALSGGSEQVYLPFLGSAWRPTTRVSVWDPDQPEMLAGKSPGLAVKIAYGRGYGLSSSGVVMYEGSHNFAGTSADQIAAQRAFLNFIFWSAAEKSVVVSATVPSKLLGAAQVSLTSTASSSGSISSYQWTSSCGGTFGTPTGANTTFTAPAAAVQNTLCVIRLTATDSCGRVAFDAQDATVLGLPDLAVTVTPSSSTPTLGSSLDYTITADDIGGLPTVSSTVSFTLPPASQYVVTSITPSPASVVCTPRVAPNDNIYDCPVGDLDGCNPVSILVKGSVVASGCFSAGVTGTTSSNDVDLGSNVASAVACSLTTGDHPILVKSVSPAAPATVNPGGTLAYTVTLFNGGSTQLDNIHLYDPYPTSSTTYVASSASITYQQYVSTIADSFAGAVYGGSTGQLPWAGSWTELSDRSGKATSGNIQVKAANCATTYCPNLVAKTDGAGIQRPLSLSGASSATLSFSYQVPTAKAGQTALTQISADGGATWRTALTISLATKVSISAPASVPFLASELTANARIRFVTTGNSSALFVPDDIAVQVQTTGRTVTSVGSTPAAGNSFDLTENLAGLLSLKPGATITATFRTTINAGVSGGTAIANTANVKTTQTGTTATSSNTVTLSTALVASSPPIAANQSLTFAEDAAASTLGISAPSDADTSAGGLSARVQKLPIATQATLYLSDGVTPISVGQTLTIAQLTALKISGAADFNGAADAFVYVVNDPQGNSSTGTATANFSALNDAPVAYPDQDVTQKGTAVVLDAPGSNDTDVDGNIDDSLCDLDPLSAGVQSSFTNAAGTWAVDTSTSSLTFGSVTYTPAAGFTGTATLSYASSDDGTPLPAKASAGGSNCSTNPSGACISVRVNAPPLAVADTLSVTSIGGTKDVTSNDSDPDGIVDVTAVDLDPGTVGLQTSFTLSGKGTFSSLLTGQVRFTPVSGFFGLASTTYTVDDFDGGTSSAVSLSVTVAGCSSAADCNDGVDCTSDVCSSGTCVNAKLAPGSSCNDQNSSTKNDVCDAGGSCAGTVYTCAPTSCEVASAPNGTGCVGTPIANGTPCNDNNACTQTDSCQSGICTGASPISCTALDQCHDAGSCVPATGICTTPTKANGASCNDGDACSQTDTCQNGSCSGSNPVVCTAADQCHTAGTCSSATGTCSSPVKSDGSSCSDGNACTQTDSCQSGICTGASPIVCTALDQCHDTGACVPATGACTTPTKTNGASCNDGDACSQSDTCQNGSCTGSNPVVCTAADQCHDAGTCSPATGTCSSPVKSNGSSCSDGNGCTQIDTCQAGSCVGASPVVCAAADQCHDAGTCSASTGLCSSPPKTNGAACSDGNACTQTDSCQNGTCTGSNVLTCTAIDQCHSAGTCAPSTGLCSSPNRANGTVCNDGDACTQTDTCQAGACVGGSAVACVAIDQCHVAGTCSPATGACSSPTQANGFACNDGNLCTQTDTCQGGACIGGAPVTCAALDQCHSAGSCSPATGLCSSPGKADGTTCNDDDGCTSGDVCQNGLCTAGPSVVCANPDKPSCSSPSGVCGCNANSDCLAAAPVCEVASHTCFGCIVDSNCSSAQFCNSETRTCVAKLPNAAQVPSLAGHSPALSGVCTSPAAIAVCASAVCDALDNACGYPNAIGPCTNASAALLCRSGVCDSGDSKCGYADGSGPCTTANAATVCRSGACSVSGVCQAPSACTVDGDCTVSQFCNTQTKICTPKLPNGASVPMVSGHAPPLNGTCDAGVGSVVCISAACDATDDRCGYRNGQGSCQASNATALCRSTACDPDTKCGYADGNGPCTAQDATTVCRSGACSVSGVCQKLGACTVDVDCASTQFCDTAAHLCTAKLQNSLAIPSLSGHHPELSGVCSSLVALAVCTSQVCDSFDNACGFMNGSGPCQDTTAGVVCRSGVCDGLDGECGYANGSGPCNQFNAALTCRSGVCSVSGVCRAPGSCTVDGDCASTQFCNTETRLCAPKLANGVRVPSIAGHDPQLSGSCDVLVALAVCVSEACDGSDDRCGYANGNGQCTASDSATVCRSGVCDASDGKCGYGDGIGPCVIDSVCRSGSCSVSGVCQPASGCTVDGDCSSTQFCNSKARKCAQKLGNGSALPTITGHLPPLTGTCTEGASGAVCSSGVCDTADDACGYLNGDGPCMVVNEGAVCRSAVCDARDAKCGYADGGGPCTTLNAATTCRSGACSNDGICERAPECTTDDDCAATQFCNTESGRCAAKLMNGVPVPKIAGHDPQLTGRCSAAAAVSVCSSGVCDADDEACGYANGVGPCTSSSAKALCRSGICDSKDGQCGYLDRSGPCTDANAASSCRSQVCSSSGLCRPAGGCLVDADCATGERCNAKQALCMASDGPDAGSSAGGDAGNSASGDAGSSAAGDPGSSAGGEAGSRTAPAKDDRKLLGGGCACSSAGQKTGNTHSGWGLLLLGIAAAAWRRQRPGESRAA